MNPQFLEVTTKVHVVACNREIIFFIPWNTLRVMDGKAFANISFGTPVKKPAFQESKNCSKMMSKRTNEKFERTVCEDKEGTTIVRSLNGLK